jgi:hypothetical protein
MIKRGSKKADTNMLWIVIGLILILVVVVVVLFFFAKGTTNFADIFTNIFRKENIDTVKSGCEVACSTNAVNDWCSAERQITFKAVTPPTVTTDDKLRQWKVGDLLSVQVTCKNWSENNLVGSSSDTNIATEAKKVLSNQITSCSSITC